MDYILIFILPIIVFVIISKNKNSGKKQQLTNQSKKSFKNFKKARAEFNKDNFFPEGLKYKTNRGHMVRSKAEVIIANKLAELKIYYHYERPFYSSIDNSFKVPDFTFFHHETKQPIIWEHLGLLSNSDYYADWISKKEWYFKNNIQENINLFTTKSIENDSDFIQQIENVAVTIKKLTVKSKN